MIKFLKKLFKPPPTVKEISEELKAVKIIDEINVYNFKHVYSLDFSIFNLYLPVERINTYKKLLFYILNTLNEGREFQRVIFIFDYKRVSVSDFFLTENNHYLENPVQEVQELLDLMKSVLLKLDSIRAKEDISFQEDFNIRILLNSGFYRSIIHVIDVFNIIQ